MMKLITMVVALCGTALAADTQATCPNMKTIFVTKRWHRVWKAGDVLENVKIVAPPGLRKALMISGKNVTLRNVLVHHSASGMGIHVYRAEGVTFENVEVRAYGNEYGPNPCSKEHSRGWMCQNVLAWQSPKFSGKNLRMYGGSDGLRFYECPNSKVDGVEVRNVRGPYPAGNGI